MNGVLDLLMSLVFFAPMAAIVAMNLALYRDERYTLQLSDYPNKLGNPAAPMLPRTDDPASAEEAYELRKAA